MEVVLVRHGSAEASAHRDGERALTLAGRQECRALGEALRRAGLLPDLVVSSPLVRAVQTAELVAAALGYGGPVRIDRALRPDSPAEGVVDLLRALVGAQTVYLVAHEPVLSSTCHLLLDTPITGLGRAEAVRVRWDRARLGSGTLVWRG